MRNTRNGLAIASMAALLGACGGGGSEGKPAPATPVAVTPTPPVVAPPVAAAPILVKNTSYANAKEQGFPAITLPREREYADAYAQADFKQNGSVMLFAAQLKYDIKDASTATTPGEFAFYSKDASGAWHKETGMIDTPNGCVHPRKAAVADFNNDGKPDVLVACHGFDAAPFTGEQNFLVLSTASGVYSSKAVPGKPGFFHAAAAADVNGDGNIDFVATDTNASSKARIFLGKGDGTFTENTLLPDLLARQYIFTIEATDVNGDGKVDLLFGADELLGDSRSRVVLGDGTSDFTGSRVLALPADAAHALTLDFVVRNGAIYALRTSSNQANFYETKAIQKIFLATLSGTTVFAASGQGWIKWLIPTATGVVSDNTQNPGGATY